MSRPLLLYLLVIIFDYGQFESILRIAMPFVTDVYCYVITVGDLAYGYVVTGFAVYHGFVLDDAGVFVEEGEVVSLFGVVFFLHHFNNALSQGNLEILPSTAANHL